MSSLSDRLTRGAAVSPSQVDHARRLVADWQLLADLAFADLTLWVPLAAGSWWCVAQVRPLTAPTCQPEDCVGAEVAGDEAEPFVLAHHEGRPVTEGEPDWSGAVPRRREVLAGRHDVVGVAAALDGAFPDAMDVEGLGATMLVRPLPLHAPGAEPGALVLVRDVTDVRRRDRALLTKDATIREIHHRVKNNLQTVSALLRLQARRMTEPSARAALEESVRRVASIAIVHETLAGSREDVVDVDDVLDQVLPMLGDLTSIGPAARTRRVGRVGELPAAAATPLVLVVTELLQNAAEHAFTDGEPGTIELLAERDGEDLVLRVRDDGQGLPEASHPA